MTKFNRILFPVDFSSNSLSALEFASGLAKQYNAKLCFLFVSQVWPATESSLPADYIQQMIAEQKEALAELKPSLPDVECDRKFVCGNPGSSIVTATKTADLCVMSTHGRRGVMRLILGSVAEYVLRNAHCPVVMTKGFPTAASTISDADEPQAYVSQVMDQIPPVHGFENMNEVLVQLRQANETGVPVVNDMDRCIGVLTMTDIDQYHDLQNRLKQRDPTVISKVFETDEYGHVRCSLDDFDQVKRHMTEAVVTVRADDKLETASDLFTAHPKIHHLVVVDEDYRPVGMLDVASVTEAKEMAKSKYRDSVVPPP